MAKIAKKYSESLAKIKQESYNLTEAIKLIKEFSTTKFDSTIELHINLDLDPKHADQQLRTTVVLPNGTGKTKKVVAFVPDELIKDAKAAGAIEASNEELINQVKEGWTDFDIAIAHPEMMREVGKIGKILGTKGLMPNPKAGTVTPDVIKAIKEFMGGKIEIKTDTKGIVHTIAGKVSFDAAKLEENVKTIFQSIKSNKPSGAKGTYFQSISISATMSPGITIDLAEVK